MKKPISFFGLVLFIALIALTFSTCVREDCGGCYGTGECILCEGTGLNTLYIDFRICENSFNDSGIQCPSQLYYNVGCSKCACGTCKGSNICDICDGTGKWSPR